MYQHPNSLMIIVIIGIAATAAALLWWPQSAQLWPQTAHEDAKQAVRARLVDPMSAQFEGLRKPSSKQPELVCGFVNAKNSLGGYTGRKPFYYDGHLRSSCILNSYTAAFLCGGDRANESIKECFPDFAIPRHAGDASNWDRFGPPNR